MTQDMMTLRALLEKSSDADLLREMIGFTAERLMALEVEGLTGAGHGERSADRITHRNGIVRGNLLELSGVLVLASVDEKPIPIFQDVTRGYPPGGDDVYPLPPVATASRGPAS